MEICAGRIRLKITFHSVATVCDLTTTHGRQDYDRASDYFAYCNVADNGHHAVVMFAFALGNVIPNPAKSDKRNIASPAVTTRWFLSTFHNQPKTRA